MTDAIFIVEEDRLLSRRSTAMREARLRELELRATVEELLNPPMPSQSVPLGSDAYRYRPL